MTTDHTKRNRWPFVLALAAGVLAWAMPVTACDTPVFRYALENWPADAYPAAIFHRGKLTGDQGKVVAYLKEVEEAGSANVRVHVVDLNARVEPRMQELWKRRSDKNLPRMVVTYPFMAPWMMMSPDQMESMPLPPVIQAGPVTMAAAETLVQSPLRKTISDLLLDGETAVWVLLESGDREADEAAAELLTRQLAVMSSELELPPEAVAAVNLGGPELRASFSLVRLKADNAKEASFLAMLLSLHEDLKKLHEAQPMVFPIYGRGRALGPLVGEHINEANIREICSGLVGPCSCRIKQENPGTDLLIWADWEGAFTDGVMLVEMLPLVLPAAKEPPAAQGSAQPLMLRNVLIVVAAIVILVVALAIGVKYWRPQH